MALVLLKVFDDPIEARVARATLEAHGVLAFLFDDAGPYPGLTLFRTRLMVSDDEREAAAALLAHGPGRSGNFDADA